MNRKQRRTVTKAVAKKRLKLNLKTFEWDPTIHAPIEVQLAVGNSLINVKFVEGLGKDKTIENYHAIQKYLIRTKAIWAKKDK